MTCLTEVQEKNVEITKSDVDYSTLSLLQIGFVRMIRRGTLCVLSLVVWGTRESGKNDDTVFAELYSLVEKKIITIN